MTHAFPEQPPKPPRLESLTATFLRDVVTTPADMQDYLLYGLDNESYENLN
jgi:hypothetical protein